MIHKLIEELKRLPDFAQEIVYHRSIASQAPRYQEPLLPLPAGLAAALLRQLGIRALYAHQARALDAVRQGHHIVVVTPTASGKSLTYNLPVLEACQGRGGGHALYLFPLKALAQDQLKSLQELKEAWNVEGSPDVAIYDGDTTPFRRKKIRQRPPQVLITNPDMLHLGILSYHPQWEAFFRGLRYIVIDELHSYRGIFGSHMAQLFRRLRRVCHLYGVDPQFIACSATIANPGEFAETLVGQPFQVIEESGAPRAAGHFLFLNPQVSPYTTAARLFTLAVQRGHKAIAFTKARKITELMHTWVLQRSPELAPWVSSYRSGFLPQERREIESALASGRLKGVISTSALEMGIDIGGMEVCLLVGYPGTIMATWQRGGRVGRGQQEFLILLVAQPDALDQYFMHHPEDFFVRGYERAVADPHNPEVLKKHLVCAAAELPLREGERAFDLRRCLPQLEELEREGRLLQDISGSAWYATERNPQRGVDLRGTGEGYTIFEEASQIPIGRIDGIRAFSECHPGAIYLHRARQYLITALDLERKDIRARPANESYYTRVLAEKETEILSIERSRSLEPILRPPQGVSRTDKVEGRGGFPDRLLTIGRATPPPSPVTLRQGRLKVTERVMGYEKRAILGQELLSTHPLQLPPQTFETVGVWLEVEDPFKADLIARGAHLMGSLHAAEHAMISLLPLFALCDRNDLGGISYALHPQIRRAAIFIYDGYPGGVGLSAQAFEIMEELLKSTLQTLADCPCLEGCPSCIHSPKCGSGNRPLDKEGARLFLQGAGGQGRWGAREQGSKGAREQEGRGAGEQGRTSYVPPSVRPAPPPPPGPSASPLPGPSAPLLPVSSAPRLLYFDLETQKSAEEVGGWENRHLMRLACAVVYDDLEKRFHIFLEEEIPRLMGLLAGGDLVIGFNLIRFDYGVLRGYTPFNFSQLKTFDILVDVQRRLGFRLSLDHLASRTLNVRKVADGLQSLRWFKAGKLDQVIEYCKKDVEITRDLFLFGQKNHYLVFERREGGLVRLPVDWDLERLLR